MLEIIAFFCGGAVMTLEMTGSRILAPYLGGSVLVWTALIGVILAFLSVGYWLGGKLADNSPDIKKLAGIILAAAFSVLGIGLFHYGLLGAVSELGFRTEFGAVIASVILFGPASLLLGMVSPYIVRVALHLRNTPVEKSGELIGRFAALSAIGSIAGTFLGGYFFISWVGSRLTVYMIATLLMLVSLLTLFAGRLSFKTNKLIFIAPLLGFAACMFFGGMQFFVEYEELRRGIVKTDTRYSHILVMDVKTAEGRVRRQLHTPPNLVQSAMYLDAPTALALNYTRHYALAWQLLPQAERFLMLGGAGYSIPKYLLQTRTDIRLDVVEIDEQVTELARKYFALKDDPRLKIYHEDARTYLNRYKGEGYNIIMGDTFSSAYNIPFQLSTVECARAIYASLSADGLFISNIISAVAGDKSELLQAISASFEEVFPEVHIYPVSYPTQGDRVQNVMLLAFKQKTALPGAEELQKRGPLPAFTTAELDTASFMLKNEWRVRLMQKLPAMHDDFAPVERYALPLMD
ncbi:MAG: fused MFS/spermidine synthase [Deltaproteobacteria bacterium]|jgi:spermidine synthase|nr:fused MFS/spermidine synthase [Deltaproteobacteria bacterium]